MKKIHLNVADWDATEILTREQLKSIFGGTGSGDSTGGGSGTVHCYVNCYNSDDESTVGVDKGPVCPTAINYGCTTKFSSCSCATK